jgi:hypothetical protein
MKNLSLLFTKDGLQWQINEAENVTEEEARFVTDETPENFIENELDKILRREAWAEIKVFSAFNHFSLTPEVFTENQLGQQIISYNSDVRTESEELMWSINQKYGVLFYYSFPKHFYQKIKDLCSVSNFHFSGERFLDSVNVNKDNEIHINLYHNQVEFLALEDGKLVLYNNLDATSEIDFLYFIMFTLSKIGFDVNKTHFYIYGEISENDTFISELEKFVPAISIMYENFKGKHFIVNS